MSQAAWHLHRGVEGPLAHLGSHLTSQRLQGQLEMEMKQDMGSFARHEWATRWAGPWRNCPHQAKRLQHSSSGSKIMLMLLVAVVVVVVAADGQGGEAGGEKYERW